MNSELNPLSTSTQILNSVNSVEYSGQEQLQLDLQIMLHFAAQRGIKIPQNVVLQGRDPAILIDNYNAMVDAITPSTVESINYINQQVLGNDITKWYKIPFISKCLFITVVALVGLILLSLSPDVNSVNQSAGLLASQGKILLYNLLFICSASLLGVMFYLLKTINDKLRSFTLLPTDSIEVNTTILIGVIAGFIISELFTFNGSTLGNSIEVQKMTLALLGGFSSDAIFSVLKGVVNKMKALFSTTP